MADASTGVIGGFDCRIDTHTAVAIDPLGQLLGTATFEATRAGYRQALAWLRSLGTVIAVGVESTGAYGAALTRHLSEAGVRVVEINQPHPHTRSRRGKSDSIDAELPPARCCLVKRPGQPKTPPGSWRQSDSSPLRLHIESRGPRPVCEECGSLAEIKDRPQVELVDLAAFGRPVRTVWRKHRWRCPNVDCLVGSWTGVDARIFSEIGADGSGRPVGDQTGRQVRADGYRRWPGS